MQVRKSLGGRAKTENGFTIIEVLIAIAILGIGILGLSSLQWTSIRGNSRAGKMTSSATWAMDRIESLLSLPYDHADLTGNVYDAESATVPIEQGLDHIPSTAGDGVDNNLNGQVDEAEETGHLTIQWKVVTDYPIQKTKTIQISVGQGIGGDRKTVVIVCHKMDSV